MMDQRRATAARFESVSRIVGFLSDSPEAVGRSPAELARILVDLWPLATGADLARALHVADVMRRARLASGPTEAELLLEKTRLLFGAVAASILVMKYENSFEPA